MKSEDMRFIRFFVIFIAVALFACSRGGNEKFEEIDALCDSDPRLAIWMLDSIDYGSLSTPDRHRYDLLSIKSRDKAYVRHTSDSLILDVIDYYQKHQKSGLYPEALYYGGRVYSDIGDLPTALTYFQQSIDAITDDKRNLRFKRNVLNQTGNLLESLRLHKQARSYLEDAYAISSELKDSTGMFYASMNLITLCMNQDSLYAAGNYLLKAMEVASSVSIHDKAWMEARRADLLHRNGNNDSALLVIRPVVSSCDTLCRNYSLCIASDIYKSAGLMDSAFLYAQELALSPVFNNRIYGFDALFSKELNTLLPKDSITFYVQAYNNHMDEYINRYEAQEALLMNSKYNYSLKQHERDRAIKEKLKAEQNRNNVVVVCSTVIIFLILMVFYNNHKKLKTEIKLRIALQLVQDISYFTETSSRQNENTPKNTEKYLIGYRPSIPRIKPQSSKDRLKEELLQNIRHLNDSKFPAPAVDSKLKESYLIEKLKQRIALSEGLTPKDQIWNEIEDAVHKSVPNFKSNLMILSLDSMDEREYRVALLIKCGFKPAQISSLLLKGKSAATDRRRSLAMKIVGSADPAAIDKIILRL